MDIRRARLDDRVEYFLDGATEAGEIDACTSSVCRLYGDSATLRAIVDENHPGKGWRGRHTNGVDLAKYANTILPALPVDRRGALIYSGISSLSYIVTELAKVLADWAATDETEGGAMKPFLRSRARLHRDGTMFHRTSRRLHSPQWIRRYIKQAESSEARHLKVVARVAFERLGLAPKEAVCDGGRSILADHRLQSEWQRQDYIALHGDRPREPGHVSSRLRLTPKQVRARHKILKRASIFAAGLIGASTVSALARGGSIMLPGPTVALQVEKRTSLAEIGHGHLSVAVVTHDGTRLADLCVYFEKTPAIDQVTGLALWMNAGLERELIAKANITSISKEGIEHPIFAERRKNQAENQRLVDQLARSPWTADTHALHRQRIDQYWAETGHVWTEILSVFVLGAPVAKRYRLWEKVST